MYVCVWVRLKCNTRWKIIINNNNNEYKQKWLPPFFLSPARLFITIIIVSTPSLESRQPWIAFIYTRIGWIPISKQKHGAIMTCMSLKCVFFSHACHCINTYFSFGIRAFVVTKWIFFNSKRELDVCRYSKLYHKTREGGKEEVWMKIKRIPLCQKKNVV